MKFVGLDGLKHFWTKAKSWIAGQITAEVTAKIAEIVANAPEDLDTLKEIADWIKNHANDAAAMNTQITANQNEISSLKTTVAGKADKIHTHTKSQITDFPTSLPANGGTATKAGFLDEYVGANGTRLTSGNITPKDATEYGGMRKDIITSSMTDGSHPGEDGHLLTMFWDNTGRWDIQLYISNNEIIPELKARWKSNKSDYGAWTDIITSNNIGSQIVAKANKIVPNYTSVALTAVTSKTTKYIKLADCTYAQTGTLQVFLNGDCFVDTLVINFGGGNGESPMLCGYYSGNSNRVYSVITQKGPAWYSGYSIYVKIGQETTLTMNVALLKGDCTINITEATTEPTNISEWGVDYGLFGNITAPNITSLEQRVAALESKV